MQIEQATLKRFSEEKNGCDYDGQTYRFRQLLSVPTSLFSLPITETLQIVLQLIESIDELLKNMIKELEVYGNMTNELHDLIVLCAWSCRSSKTSK
jgi:hypothetical protein